MGADGELLGAEASSEAMATAERTGSLQAFGRSQSGQRMSRWEYLRRCAQSLGVAVESIVEVGVYKGDSAAWFRRTFPQARLLLVDPWCQYDDYLRPRLGNVFRVNARSRSPVELAEDSELAFRGVCERFRDDPQVSVLRDFSLNAALRVTGPFDLVFIDANHGEASVRQDILSWAPKVRSGGLLAGHDFKCFCGVRRAVESLLAGHIASGYNKGDVWIWRKP